MSLKRVRADLQSRFLLGGLLIFAQLTLSVSLVGQEKIDGVGAIVNGIRINISEGKPQLDRDNSTSDLTSDLELQDGDRVITDQNSRTEILLQPGNYLRIGYESKLRVLSTNHEKIRLRLEQGSINLELLRDSWDRPDTAFLNDMYDPIRIITPHAEIIIAESGIYRVNVSENGSTSLVVGKGEAMINGRRVKEKRTAVDIQGNPTVSESEAKSEDNFDSWCRQRAEQLVQANHSLKREAPWSKSGAEATVDLPPNKDRMHSPYVVSAKPGKVTFVDSGAQFAHPQSDWRELTVETELASNDRLRTDANSRVELMIFPDIYLRLDCNSELVFEELSNDGVSIKVLHGAAILDVAIFDRKQLPQFKIGSSSVLAIVDNDGNYRVDASQNAYQFSVREGRLLLSGNSLSGCYRMVEGSRSECDKKRKDNFDFWSQTRGEGAFFYGRSMASRVSRFRQQRSRNTGFWYRHPRLAYYTFVPFSVDTFHSPYGGSYSTVLSSGHQPFYRFDPKVQPSTQIPGPPDRPEDH